MSAAVTGAADRPRQGGAAGVCVAALYHFARFDDPAVLRGPLARLCCSLGVKGTLLLAREGVNGAIAGPDAAVARVAAHVRALPGCAGLEVKYSRAPSMPFRRMKVRLKKEIVSMGEPDVDPLRGAGVHVEPGDWNALISRDDVVVIDTRNDYEMAIGAFEGAVRPDIRTFREFPAWFRRERERLLAPRGPDGAPPKVAMYCTGGIRCEKSTAFLKREGVAEVFHLRGGVLNYLETVPERDSLWRGDCFVFDQRVAVGHGLAPSGHTLCPACRRPLSAADRARPEHVEGVSCAACAAGLDADRRAALAERHRQEQLARRRGRAHLGADMATERARRRGTAPDG